MSASELATSYAALILADDGVDITADKINSIVNAAKVPDYEAIWATLFAKALNGKDLSSILLNVGSGGGGAAAASAPAASSGGAAAPSADAAAPAEEKKEEEKEESDDDMGFGLFD